VFGLRKGVGVGGHVTLTGVLVWLVVLGVAELAFRLPSLSDFSARFGDDE
jgi:ribosomal protein L5